MGFYMLEVQKYIGFPESKVPGVIHSVSITCGEPVDLSIQHGKFIHVGYMGMLFKTPKHAADYYRKHNPHLRPIRLTGFAKGFSDWDPDDELRYVIRVNYGEQMDIPAFEKQTDETKSKKRKAKEQREHEAKAKEDKLEKRLRKSPHGVTVEDFFKDFKYDSD